MDKKFVSFVAVFFLVFGLFISLIIFEDPLTRFTRATINSTPSGDQSLMFAFPIQAPADSKSEVAVTVFVRTEKGTDISKTEAGKLTVSLKTTLGQLDKEEAPIDENGKAEFKLRSDAAGVAVVNATIKKGSLVVPIVKPVSIVFNPV